MLMLILMPVLVARSIDEKREAYVLAASPALAVVSGRVIDLPQPMQSRLPSSNAARLLRARATTQTDRRKERGRSFFPQRDPMTDLAFVADVSPHGATAPSLGAIAVEFAGALPCPHWRLTMA
jgi:hypothetical protein